jgi:hypothetical protein
MWLEEFGAINRLYVRLPVGSLRFIFHPLLTIPTEIESLGLISLLHFTLSLDNPVRSATPLSAAPNYQSISQSQWSQPSEIL